MASVRFSGKAKADILEIAAYTLQAWGETQMIRYLDDLEECAKLLASRPDMGRACDWIRPGLHRFEHRHHVLFYRKEPRGVLIVRILHEQMLPDQDTFREEPES